MISLSEKDKQKQRKIFLGTKEQKGKEGKLIH